MSRLILFVLTAFFFIQVAWSNNNFQLEKVEILAWKDFQKFNFGDTLKLSSEDFSHSSSQSVADLLKDLPGIHFSQNGGPGGRMSLFMRGTEARHVVFTLDGLKLNDVTNVDRQFDVAFFSTPLIKEVIIYKGPQAVMLGSDAMGGAIEFISHKGEKAPRTLIQLNGGSFGTIDTSIRRDWSSQDSSSKGSLVLHRMSTDGISRLNKKRFNAHEADGASVIQMSSSSTHLWTKNINSDFLISYLHGQNELDGTQLDNSVDKSLNDQYILQQKTNIKLNSKQSFSLRNGLNRHQRFLVSISQGSDSFSGSNIEHEALFRTRYQSQDYLMGLAAQHEEFVIEKNQENFDVGAIFLQSRFEFDDLKLQAGIRSEEHVKYGGFQTGSAGMTYSHQLHEFGLQASRGYKAPSLYQLYAPDLSGSPVGNPDLEPEKNNSIEARWRYWDSFIGTEISAFQNNLFDLITYSSGQGYLNQSKFNIQGMEFSGMGRLEDLFLRLSYTFQDFIHHEQVVLRRPQQSWLGSLTYSLTDQWEFQTKFKWYAHRFDLDPSGEAIKLNSYETFDLGVKYIMKKVSLGLQMNNLLDRSYEELYGYSVMPRSYFFHVGLEI